MQIDFEAILQLFRAESEENLLAMEEALLALEANPDDEEALGTVFRTVHTLKGDAGNLGLEAPAALAHVAEDLLDALREGVVPVSEAAVSTLLETGDALRALLRDPEAVADTALVARLAALAAEVPAEETVESSLSFATPASRVEPGAAPRARTLRVEMGRLDRLLDLAGELTIARGRMRQTLLADGGHAAGLQALEETDRLYAELQELATRLRMVPVGPLFRQHHRAVRDLAAGLGRQARLVTEGEEVEVDSGVVEHLRDALLHMVRNALDHGIESPEARRAAGKDPFGTVTLRARHEGGSIVVQVEDDGAGLDPERIAARARERGLLRPGESPSPAELFRLVLEPGFSTADRVTALSGRGVGMDVVRRNVESLRGSLELDSRPGQGTTVTLRLPLTLAIIEGFYVGVGPETYVIPLGAVSECLALPAEEGVRETASGILPLRGEALPYVRLRSLLGATGAPPARESVVVLRGDGRPMGVVVDTLHGEGQAVVKPLGHPFRQVEWASGATILGTGRVGLILDVPALLRRAEEREPVLVG